MRKNFVYDLEVYVGLLNMRLIDISNDIQDLSRILNDLDNELAQICDKLKVKK